MKPSPARTATGTCRTPAALYPPAQVAEQLRIRYDIVHDGDALATDLDLAGSERIADTVGAS